MHFPNTDFTLNYCGLKCGCRWFKIKGESEKEESEKRKGKREEDKPNVRNIERKNEIVWCNQIFFLFVISLRFLKTFESKCGTGQIFLQAFFYTFFFVNVSPKTKCERYADNSNQ